MLCRLITVVLEKISGAKNPPQNRIPVKQDIKTILEYSAKKKKTKGTLAYSVIYPATNSDSYCSRIYHCPLNNLPEVLYLLICDLLVPKNAANIVPFLNQAYNCYFYHTKK